FVGGVSVFGKDSKLKKVLKMSGIKKEDAIYIGDELRDIQASKKVGIPCGSVTWGVNDADALAALSPDEMFYEVEQILQRV
ncbi:MAG: HAD hydrolase-like protein, partial [Candidatus Cloacimonadota bacterium]|nr:HAD hydrolase-like protein [Candidatus Cloacimonadota bacterium]